MYREREREREIDRYGPGGIRCFDMFDVFAQSLSPKKKARVCNNALE